MNSHSITLFKYCPLIHFLNPKTNPLSLNVIIRKWFLYAAFHFFFYLHDKTLRLCHEILSSDVTQIMMCHKIHCSPFILFAQNFWFKMRFVCSHILFGVTLRLVDPLQPTVLAPLRITYESQVSSGFISSTFNEQALLFLSLTLEIE
jgi:hypothetical protein